LKQEEAARYFHQIELGPLRVEFTKGGRVTVTLDEILQEHSSKLIVLFLAAIAGPGLYKGWSESRAEAALREERESVGHKASTAGIMWVGAWKACVQIGIRDVDACSKYKGVLLQEIGAPVQAKLAIEHRDTYAKSCFKFHTEEYCQQLFNRSIQLSSVQSKD
jgi:hypothetical protein